MANISRKSDDDLVDFLIKEEGFLSKPTNIGDGKITLGSGLTDPKWHELYKKRGNKWSKEDNRKAVASEIASRRRWAESNIPNWDDLPDSSQKALLAYKYNYDFNAANSPKLYEALRNNNLLEAAKQMDATSKDPKFKKGLEQRRARERSWFLQDVSTKEYLPEPLMPEYNAYPVSSYYDNPYARRLLYTQPQPVMIPEEQIPQVRYSEPEERIKMDALNALESLGQLYDFKKENAWENQPEPERFIPKGRINFVAYDEGGQMNAPKTWNDLSMAEKAEMMKVAILNGITDLATIKQKYNEFAEGGSIHIDPSKKGTFTAAATKHGMGVQEFASKVLANKENYSPAMVKKANFARNASKFKHSFGGPLIEGAMNYFENGGQEDHIYDVGFMPELVVTAPYTSDSQRMRANLEESIARAAMKDARDAYALQRNMNETQSSFAQNFGLNLLGLLGGSPITNLGIMMAAEGAPEIGEAMAGNAGRKVGEYAATLAPILPMGFKGAVKAANAVKNNVELYNTLHTLNVPKEFITQKPIIEPFDDMLSMSPEDMSKSKRVFNREKYIQNNLRKAQRYKRSPQYRELVKQAAKESELMGTGWFPEDAFVENTVYPQITSSYRRTGSLGSYTPATNTIDFDYTQWHKETPYHEGLHWQRVASPNIDVGPKYNAWAKAYSDGLDANIQSQLFDAAYNDPAEYNRMIYAENAREYLKAKVNKALYPSVPSGVEMRKPWELHAHGMTAGEALGLRPFEPFPGYTSTENINKVANIVSKAREYDSHLWDVKAGSEEEAENFWKILTGNYFPSITGATIGIGSLKNKLDNK